MLLLSGTRVMLWEPVLTAVYPPTVIGSSVMVWPTVWSATTLSSATLSSVPFQRYLTL